MIWLITTVLIGAVILLGLYQYKKTNKIIIRKQEITFANFPRSFGEVSIFYISDIRRCVISHRILEQVKESVDFVIIGGNLTDKGVPLERVANNIEVLREIGPLYFVWGEKDYEGDAHELDALLLDHKVTILDNTCAAFESYSGEKLILLGVDDVVLKRDRLDLALSDSGEDGFRILASHDCSIENKVSKDDRISLILSGVAKNQSGKVGIYDLGHTKQYISNGFSPSYSFLRLRPPEVCIVTVKAIDY
ncbi:metallophosphoesterase [Ectobacillus polymachus]|uniref:metallophosphoesterase n=1 Tax=Ectobacillus polymachus TaxID=1508806 RepID=UPI003A86C594